MQIVFYDSVSDVGLFSRLGYYSGDISALRLNGDTVLTTNSVSTVMKTQSDLFVGWYFKRSLLPGVIARLKGSRVIFTGVADYLYAAGPTGRGLRGFSIK